MQTIMIFVSVSRSLRVNLKEILTTSKSFRWFSKGGFSLESILKAGWRVSIVEL